MFCTSDVGTGDCCVMLKLLKSMKFGSEEYKDFLGLHGEMTEELAGVCVAHLRQRYPCMPSMRWVACLWVPSVRLEVECSSD